MISEPLANLGIDLEDAANLPWSDVPESDPFYLDNFSRSEIAYCRRQPDPRLAFCGLWAAKEAVIKCAGGLTKLSPAEVEIGRTANGQPVATVRATTAGGPLQSYRVSLSQAGQTAIAACVRLAPPGPP